MRNLLSQPKVNANDWCVPEPLFSMALVGEVRGHISETGERHGIVGSVFTVTPCPVGEVEHEIGMHEQIGPFRLAQHIVEIGEPAALQLEAHTGHRMEPFGKAEVGLEN